MRTGTLLCGPLFRESRSPSSGLLLGLPSTSTLCTTRSGSLCLAPGPLHTLLALPGALPLQLILYAEAETSLSVGSLLCLSLSRVRPPPVRPCSPLPSPIAALTRPRLTAHGPFLPLACEACDSWAWASVFVVETRLLSTVLGRKEACEPCFLQERIQE